MLETPAHSPAPVAARAPRSQRTPAATRGPQGARSLSAKRGLVLLAGCGLLMQAGWVALWPLSEPLSHNRRYVAEYFAAHPAAEQLFRMLFTAAARFLPHLDDDPGLTSATVGFVLTCGLLTLGYLGALAVLNRTQVSPKAALLIVLGFGILFQITLTFIPGVFTQDIFGYMAYGNVAAVHGMNPYIWPPSAFAKDALLQWVAPIWRSLPSPYGPLWVDVEVLVSSGTYTWTPVNQVLAYKALASVLHLTTLCVLWRLMRRPGLVGDQLGRRVAALTIYAWNPLVLFEITGDAHNDVFMVLLLVAGFLPAAAGLAKGTAPRAAQRWLPSPRELAASVLFVLSALVKYLSGVTVVFYTIVVVRTATSWRDRALRLVLLGIVCGSVTLFLFGPWLQLPDSLQPLIEQTDGLRYTNSLPDQLALTVSDNILQPAGWTLVAARDGVREIEKLVTYAVFGGFLIWQGRRLWLIRGEAATLRELISASILAPMLYVLLVSVWVQTWYYVLPLALATVLGWRSLLSRVVVAFSLTALPALYASYYLEDRTPPGVLLMYGLIPTLVLVHGLMRRRRAPALASPQPVPQPSGYSVASPPA